MYLCVLFVNITSPRKLPLAPISLVCMQVVDIEEDHTYAKTTCREVYLYIYTCTYVHICVHTFCLLNVIQCEYYVISITLAPMYRLC